MKYPFLYLLVSIQKIVSLYTLCTILRVDTPSDTYGDIKDRPTPLLTFQYKRFHKTSFKNVQCLDCQQDPACLEHPHYSCRETTYISVNICIIVV